MASKKFDRVAVKKYRGVYYRKSDTKYYRERPDRVYWINFKDSETGKLRWERCGWASEGWTPEAAQNKRTKLLEQDRTGEYKPKKARKKDALTFGELMEKHYLPWSNANKKRARDDKAMYRNWLKSRLAAKTLKEISPFDLERLKKDMLDEGKADATVKHGLCLVRQAFNKAVSWRLWDGPNPCSQVSFPKPNNSRQRFLNQEEADELIAALRLRSPQVARMAIFALYGGLRTSEIFGLKWANVDFTNGIIQVFDTKSIDRPIFITEPIKKVLEELTPGQPDETLFKTKEGQPVVWLSKVFRVVVEDLGLNDGITDSRQRVVFHTLRHTYASWAVMAGIPLYVVGNAIGHKSTVMTQRYAHLAPESQRQAFEAVASNHQPKKRLDEVKK